MSGVGVGDECITKFQELKLGHKLRYIIYKISDDWTEIQYLEDAPASASYEEFINVLPGDDCRYAVYDFEYEEEGGQRNKILFVVWAPDSARIKAKMLYASSKDAFRKKLVGIGTEIQATDLSEIDHSTVLDKVKKLK